MSRKLTFKFGRLNIAATYQSKMQYLMQGLTADSILPQRYGFAWYFVDIEQVSTDSDSYIAGYLVIFRPSGSDEVVDRPTHRLRSEVILNQAESKARFLLHVTTGIIAFHTTEQIPANIFRKKFSELFEQGHNGLFVNADIQPIDEPGEFLDVLENSNKIRAIHVGLHPSNPHTRWQRVDDRIKALKASYYREEYYAKTNQHLTPDDETKEKVQMALDGYGEASITEQRGAEQVTVYSKDNPVTHKVDASRMGFASQLLEALSNKFAELFDRMQ